MTRARVARRLLRLLRPLTPLMSVSATARVANQGLGVAIPALGAALVVGGWSAGGVLALLGALALAKGAFRYLEQFTGHAVAFRLLSELRIDTYRRIVPLAPAGLEDDRTGDLVSRVVGDIDRVEPFYAHTIAPLVGAVAVPVLTAAGLAVWVDPMIAVVFIPFPLATALIVPWLRTRRVAGLSERARIEAGETASLFTDVVQGAREVAVFDARDVVADRVDAMSRAVAAARSMLARIAAARAGLGDLLAGGAVVAVGVAGTALLAEGVIDIAGLSAAVVAAWVGTYPARALEGIVADVEEALAGARRLFELADREPPVAEPDGPVGRPVDGTVAFEGVTVGFHRSGQPALSDVDVSIPDGSFVALVGPSGSGKSTLVELLARFRDPDTGRVVVGGADIRRVDPSLLRREVALVPQRPDVFYGSVADNLLLADPDATAGEMWDALERASLGDWARSLDDGLDTLVGERGETLSGGQRQRLAIARCFLRDPRVLVLDEATSELDTETERQVLGEIARERGRRTLIVAAHRLDTVADADEIIVLDRGRLVERGAHDDLVASGGVYAGLWRRHIDVVETV